MKAGRENTESTLAVNGDPREDITARAPSVRLSNSAYSIVKELSGIYAVPH
jgi:hypothetical protein